MSTALLLAALAVTSLGWVGARANWRAAEEEVLRLCTELRRAEGRAWAAEQRAEARRAELAREAELRAEFAADESAP